MQRYMPLVLLLALPLRAQPVPVTLDSATRHQTILGWGATAARMDLPDRLRAAVLDEAVNDLGLTRLRFEIPRREWEDAVNDDNDPYHVSPAAFRSAEIDRLAEDWVLPFRQRVEARREPFNLYISPSFFDGGSSGTAPAWLLGSPAEYTEWATAFIVHLRTKYGLVPDLYSICNEAGNNNGFDPRAMAAIARELGPALARLGLKTRLEYPECVNPETTVRYLQAIAKDEDVWPWIGVLSYHLYGECSTRPTIRDLGLARHVPTAQTEFMGTTINDLYRDLTDGGCSYWEHYVLSGRQTNGQVHNGCYLGTEPMGTAFARYPHYWMFRAVMHYVRPGAVRIAATSPEPTVGCLAFDQGGGVTAIVLNTRGGGDRQVALTGLPAGRYGVCQSQPGLPYRELGVQTVTAGSPLSLNVARDCALTVYPYSGVNQAPVVTDAVATPSWLASPRDALMLSAQGTDAESNAITWRWSVIAQPAGAAAALASPDSAKTGVTGLTVPGEYGFTAAASDGAGTGRREVWVRVNDRNLPPSTPDLHYRLPVTLALPATQTELRGWSIDPEGDALTYAWTIVSQPAGAAARLATPDKGQTKLDGLTTAGVYRCRLTASDGTSTVSNTIDVTVHPDLKPPVISAVQAWPAALVQPAASSTLTVSTSDPQGGAVTHWWSVLAAPAGAKPLFTRPGSAKTDVAGLELPGQYTFEVAAINQTRTTRGRVAVTVTASATAPTPVGAQPLVPGVVPPGQPGGAQPIGGRPAGGQPGGAAPAATGQPSDPPQPTTRDDRVITARGYTLGRVSAIGPTWIEVTSDSGATARYIPEWHGGMPANGGGPDKAVVAQIQALAVGARVRADWHVNDHIRLEQIRAVP